MLEWGEEGSGEREGMEEEYSKTRLELMGIGGQCRNPVQ